jgi:hypothetical protein
MLDVHPPHAPTHTWRDFFIHVATICVGLLIAVGLEQTVEYTHHQREVAKTRRELRRERELNQQRFQLLEENLDSLAHTLREQSDLLAWLRHHPHAGPGQWPVHPHNVSFPGPYYSVSAWQTAKSSGVLAYMPAREVKTNDELYTILQQINSYGDQLSKPSLQYRATAIDGPLEDQTYTQMDAAWDILKELRVLGAILITRQHRLLVRYPDFPDDSPFFQVRGLMLNEVHQQHEVDPWEDAMRRLNAIDAQEDKE